MTDEQAKAMIDLLERIAAAVEGGTVARKKRATPAAKKSDAPAEGVFELRDASVIVLSKEFPNAWGYFKAKIGYGIDRTQNWFDTKDPELGDLLEVAAESGALVNVTYTETVNGQYTNRHIKSLVYAGGEAPAGAAEAPADDDEVPF